MPLLLLVACGGSTVATPSGVVQVCPILPPLPRADAPAVSKSPPGLDRLPFGKDLDLAFHDLARTYAGPDRPFPVEAMLDRAVDRLAAVHPSLHVTRAGDDLVLEGPSTPLRMKHVKDLDQLTSEIAVVAELARAALPAGVMEKGNDPERILLDGALSALAWRTTLYWRTIEPSVGTKPATQPAEPIVTRVGSDGIARVTIRRFAEGVAARARADLAGASGLRGVIVDLRGNTGGLLSEAVALADLFVRGGCLAIVRRPERSEVEIASPQPHDVDVPLVVMVDNETGSGAELVAATLRALGRAKIFGAPTAGAAVIELHFSLPSGAHLKIPIGALHAGDGSAIDGHPIVPDVMATDGADARAIELLGAR